MDLGLSLAEFGAMTPRYFAALCKRRKANRRHEDFMLAQLTASVINFGGRGAKKWFQPSDLMPGETQPRRRRESPEAINERIRAAFRGLMKAPDGSGQ